MPDLCREADRLGIGFLPSFTYMQSKQLASAFARPAAGDGKETREMRVWCFSGADGLGALTDDENGTDLPPDLGPWRPVATLTLGEHGDEREAKRLIKEHGFCCFDETAEERVDGTDQVASVLPYPG